MLVLALAALLSTPAPAQDAAPAAARELTPPSDAMSCAPNDTECIRRVMERTGSMETSIGAVAPRVRPEDGKKAAAPAVPAALTVTPAPLAPAAASPTQAAAPRRGTAAGAASPPADDGALKYKEEAEKAFESLAGARKSD